MRCAATEQLRHFVRQNQSWMAEHHVRTEPRGGDVRRRSGRASSCWRTWTTTGRTSPGRWLWWRSPRTISPSCSARTARSGRSTGDATSGHRSSTPATVQPGDVVGRYHAALDAGDVDAIVGTFEPEATSESPWATTSAHRGSAELRSYYLDCFSAGGGIGLEHCAMTDDGVRCVVEYNCVRWGSHDLPPQAGLGVYERGPDGLLAAVRIYDDVEAPSEGSSAMARLG